MSDLQLALLLLGAVIILVVIAFNWWQERRLRNEAARHFEAPRGDVLMDDDFQLDPDAILREESRDLKRLATDDFDALSIGEDKAEAAQAYSAPAGTDDTILEMESLTPPVEADDFAQLDEETVPTVPAEDGAAFRSYEEHAWQSDSVTESVRTAESEPGLDEETEGQATGMLALSPEIDGRIDLIAVLHLPQPVSGARLREFLVSVTDIDKAKYLHGLDADGNWALLTREQEAMEFGKVTCAVQLADRSGFISRSALDRFQHEVERIGHKLNAQVEWLNQGDALQQASELDQFCIEVDKMVGFHLVQGGNGPFTGTKFRGLAEASGMVLGTDGGFHSENEAGLRQFSVFNRDNYPFSPEMLRTSVIHGVTFQLDIPRVANCIEVFNQMVLTARQMEKSLGAMLVDDNQRPLGETEIEKIRQQLKAIHARMVTWGIVPGSPSALRLFS